jgi:hypothetical protein
VERSSGATFSEFDSTAGARTSSSNMSRDRSRCVFFFVGLVTAGLF